jgi:molybdopterin converting factor small subunit
MQRYSGQKELEIDVPEDPGEAVAKIVRQFRIPWAGRLEKSVRVFINKELLEVYAGSGRKLAEGDRISFIPMSDGG